MVATHPEPAYGGLEISGEHRDSSVYHEAHLKGTWHMCTLLEMLIETLSEGVEEEAVHAPVFLFSAPSDHIPTPGSFLN